MKTPWFAALFLAIASVEAGESRLVYDLAHGVTSVTTQMEGLGKKLEFKIEPVRKPLTSSALRSPALARTH